MYSVSVPLFEQESPFLITIHIANMKHEVQTSTFNKPQLSNSITIIHVLLIHLSQLRHAHSSNVQGTVLNQSYTDN